MILKRSKFFPCSMFVLCAVQVFALMGDEAQERIRIKMYDGPDLPEDRLAVLAFENGDYGPKSINGKDPSIKQAPADILLAPGIQTLVVDIDDYRGHCNILRDDFKVMFAPRATDLLVLEGLESNTSIRFEALPGHRYRISHKAIPLIKKDNILYFFHFTKLCVVEDQGGINPFLLGAFRECLNLRPEDEPKPVSTDMNDAHLYDAENPLPPESTAIVRIRDFFLCVVEITGTTYDQQQIVCHAGFCGDSPTIHLKPGTYSFSASYSMDTPYLKAKSTTNATAELQAEAGRAYELNAKIPRGEKIVKWSIQFKER